MTACSQPAPLLEVISARTGDATVWHVCETVRKVELERKLATMSCLVFRCIVMCLPSDNVSDGRGIFGCAALEVDVFVAARLPRSGDALSFSCYLP